ncbi:Mo-dependent nitrogenase C-terminal domain-containing protein [Myxacorys almedinensis]|uniref:Nitrogenase n=1 Tax=Myxacorys almedinensis A TaxID=2690445 RepID=A0A8J7Z1S9_9CYAN|nr:Mo-dependent nitrogenase C-terminal domain-containing protein [Myxacorys almedinensis]NDJ18069.1 nitrogenase [Myxacorys almedinensis A]
MSFQQLDRRDWHHQSPKDQKVTLAGWVLLPDPTTDHNPIQPPQQPKFDLLRPFRRKIDQIEVCNTRFAHLVCKLVPAQCPFERDVQMFGKTLFHIPPLCKLNPLYDEVVSLRFRALCYLADECGEDISCYC